ncbi:flavodoxin family protein [Clostridium estertheticum]|uniref:flavodoxin family protein n=1 Tax=Clostridium estertheticum TaxID=238834 RepID=UPI001C0C96C4|nr:flavodoxin family protein [Clostridium estertheticum]MBU3074828.1 flavodoxin family protein [Clostridium estertheticum]MBU3165043.1 flavodoxin family protein [Clostridium estertheticum]
MKILVLNGSPRLNGNTTAMVDAFAEGAREKGHEVNIIPVGQKKIGGCLGCEFCHTRGNGECVQKDDMGEVYKELETADMLIFASPIYFFSITGQLQSAITRFYATGKPRKVSQTALFLSSGAPEVYTAVIQQYKNVIDYFEAEDKGIKMVYGKNNKSAAMLADMKTFGKSL